MDCEAAPVGIPLQDQATAKSWFYENQAPSPVLGGQGGVVFPANTSVIGINMTSHFSSCSLGSPRLYRFSPSLHFNTWPLTFNVRLRLSPYPGSCANFNDTVLSVPRKYSVTGDFGGTQVEPFKNFQSDSPNFHKSFIESPDVYALEIFNITPSTAPVEITNFQMEPYTPCPPKPGGTTSTKLLILCMVVAGVFIASAFMSCICFRRPPKGRRAAGVGSRDIELTTPPDYSVDAPYNSVRPLAEDALPPYVPPAKDGGEGEYAPDMLTEDQLPEAPEYTEIHSGTGHDGTTTGVPGHVVRGGAGEGLDVENPIDVSIPAHVVTIPDDVPPDFDLPPPTTSTTDPRDAEPYATAIPVREHDPHIPISPTYHRRNNMRNSLSLSNPHHVA
ncbi:uncharacterized protein EV422DRAFT_229870 [Fimicolochytrium jonesii]|uniref:uncharacterized protein n=1 Tax=Fimicolochytrium jonesii TaxID=1396493 RepID=UPI0022FECEF3|nr:uncharacterized protein EV422DRAFT_229870 [Fimicolochytrium jonesii]KAI8817270.1 hypothetical protein EV422DRAFT_229870 [Fimicolochytrium jonesii]